jgi:hypothetical protein
VDWLNSTSMFVVPDGSCTRTPEAAGTRGTGRASRPDGTDRSDGR